jgi:hypothetical protein
MKKFILKKFYEYRPSLSLYDRKLQVEILYKIYLRILAFDDDRRNKFKYLQDCTIKLFATVNKNILKHPSLMFGIKYGAILRV